MTGTFALLAAYMYMLSFLPSFRLYVCLSVRRHVSTGIFVLLSCCIETTNCSNNTPIGNESVGNIIINDTINLIFKTAIGIFLISNHNSFRVLFDKIASVYFI